MLLALPLFAFALLVDRYWRPRRDVREAFLAAAITWGVATASSAALSESEWQCSLPH